MTNATKPLMKSMRNFCSKKGHVWLCVRVVVRVCVFGGVCVCLFFFMRLCVRMCFCMFSSCFRHLGIVLHPPFPLPFTLALYQNIVFIIYASFYSYAGVFQSILSLRWSTLLSALRWTSVRLCTLAFPPPNKPSFNLFFMLLLCLYM